MDITTSQTTLNGVLDQYYSWLVKLMGPKGNDRTALFSSVITHDILKEAPLYTLGVFRSFADRTLTISPEDFGAGNSTDRYSRRYRDLIEIAGAELYGNATYTEKQLEDLQKADGDITEAANEILRIRKEVLREWTDYSRQAALTPGTPQYTLERANFYNPYLVLIRNQRTKLSRGQSKRVAVHLSVFKGDKDAMQLSKVYERCNAIENVQPLPSSPDVEVIYKLDPIKIGEAASGGLFTFEEELAMDPSVSLIGILDKTGTRDITISNKYTADFSHDQAWSASGSASWIPIFSASVGRQSESHFRQSIQNLESITIACDYLTDCWVKRKDWFDSTIYKNKYIQAVLQDRPDMAALLALCISSAIIVRGLKVTFTFKSVNDVAVWSSWSESASGGFNVFGFSVPVGSGGSSGNSSSHKITTKDRSVTFTDGTDVCRLLALRASNLIPEVSLEAVDYFTRPLSETHLGSKVLQAWAEGETLYGQLPVIVVDAFNKKP
jgi:hypothetical protein